MVKQGQSTCISLDVIDRIGETAVPIAGTTAELKLWKLLPCRIGFRQITCHMVLILGNGNNAY